MSDPSPDPVPQAPSPSGAILPELQDLGQKLDLVAGAVATIASGHHELLDHLAESIARQSHDALEVANRLTAIERQVLSTAQAGDDDPGGAAVLERLGAIERAVAALPGAAPGVESTFVALADRLDAFADGEREGREALTALTAAVEAIQVQPGEAEAVERDDGPDLRAELQALTDAQRAVADELASLGPRVNELLDRHPDGLPVPAPPPRPAEDEIVVPDEVTAPPSTALDLAPLEGQVAELAVVAAAQAGDLTLALEVLSKVADAIDRLDDRTEDRLAAIRDASTTPVTALEAATAGSAAVLARLDDLVAAMDDLVPDPTALDARLDQLTQAVAALSVERAEPPPATPVPAPAPVPATDPLLEARLTHHIDTALAGMLRLFDDRLVALRAALGNAGAMGGVAPAASQNMGGFEAGAVMGAAQAAWSRLEQRLDSEFDDISRQLQALAALVEQTVASTESLASRPVVSGDQMRKAAVSLRDTVVNAGKQRRERRGGPKGLGPGSSDSSDY